MRAITESISQGLDVWASEKWDVEAESFRLRENRKRV